MQLNKYLSHSGLCARRKAAELIETGKIIVNGSVVKDPWREILSADRVTYMGKSVKPENKVYIVINKPKNTVCTTHDEKERDTVLSLLPKNIQKRLYPIGRLDLKTTGVLLVTNDGLLTQHLLHPKFNIKKTYHALLNRPLEHADMVTIKNKGIFLEDGKITVDTISTLSNDKKRIKITIHNGKYRIIRRLFEALNYHVMELERVKFAGITSFGLTQSGWRYLTKKEVDSLYELLPKTEIVTPVDTVKGNPL